MKKGSYQTISEDTVEALDERVTAAIQEGWEPFGGPYVIQGEPAMICQALRKQAELEAIPPPPRRGY